MKLPDCFADASVSQLDAHEVPLILMDFPIRQIHPHLRRTVREAYPRNTFDSKFSNYVLVAEILGSNGDYLMVPPELGKCYYEQKSGPHKRPPDNHVNSQESLAILKGATNA
jgi:hypothetical protein